MSKPFISFNIQNAAREFDVLHIAADMSWYCDVIDGEPEGKSPYFRNEN
jgi:hypothetical protein